MDADADSDRVVDALAQTSFEVMSILNRVAADEGISITQLRLLGSLRGRTPRMNRLADHLGLERSTLSGLIDRAEQRGLVVRRPSEDDKRVIEIALTPDGELAARRVETLVRGALRPRTTRLDPAARHDLSEHLERMLGTPDE